MEKRSYTATAASSVARPGGSVLARLSAFVQLSRLKFLAGGIAGAIFGTLLAARADGQVDWPAYGIAQVTITALHLMTHYSNEYFDREYDARTSRTPFSGGSGVLGSGRLAHHVALCAALVCAGAGAGGMLVLWSPAQRPAAALLALAIGVLAWCYSAPPLRLCARGLGEIATALVVGTLVPLCAYAAQRGVPDARTVLDTLPGAAAMFAMMLAVEYPDLAADAASGKRNLIVRIGVRKSAALARGALVAIYAAVIAAVATGAPPAYGLLQAVSLPLAFGYARALALRTDADLAANAALAGRGVALFFIVTLYGALAYAAVLPGAAAHAAIETNPRVRAVEDSVTATPTLETRLNAALDEVRPGILRDGGDVWLINVTGRVAYVQMVGACGGCAMATATLKGAIETVVRQRCPEIERVEQI